MTIIELMAKDQKLDIMVEPVVAAGDVKSTKIHVEFSPEWAGYAKTAVFFTSKDVENVIEQVMTDNTCKVPHEVIETANNLFIGVRGVIASTGAVKTSTLVKYKIEEGAPCGTGTTVPPTADVYQQLLSKTNDLDKRLSNLLADETEDGEVKDIRYGADGVTYPTAGDAVREQFRNATEKQEANSAAIEGFLYPVTENIAIAKLASGTCWDTGYYSEIGTTLPEEIPQAIPQGNINNCFTWSSKVNKGDVFGLHVAAINTMGARLPQQCLLITNKSRVVVGSILVQDLLAGTKYTAKEDGYLYLSGTYDSGLTVGMQYFWIKKYRDMSEIPSSGGVSQEDFEEEIGKLSREKADKKDLEGLASETYVDDKVEDLKVNGIQQTPLFANSIEECTDTTKLYVLPDGMIYGYIPVEKENYENAVETSRNYGNTDVYNDGKGYKDDVYLSSDVLESNGGDGSDADYTSTGFIPIAFKTTGIFPTLYIKGLEWVNKSHSRFYLYSSTPSLITGINQSLNMIGSNSNLEANFTMESIGEKYWKLTPKDTLYSNLNNAIPSYFRMSLKGSGENLIISLDDPIEAVIEYEWGNTGYAFIPADYEDRIIVLESENEQLKKELSSVKESLNDVEKNDSVGVPDYVAEEAERVAKQVYSHQNANTFTFFAISDMHEHLTNKQIMTSNFHAGKAMEFIRGLVHVDFAVCLGDIGWGSGVKDSVARATIELGIAEIRSANAKIDGAFRGIPNFRTTGNHCNLAYNYEFNGNDYLDENELFPLYGAYNTGAVYPVGEKDRGYCHRDFEDWKLRVICMNSSDLKGLDVSGGTSEYTSGMQLKWFAELLDMSDKADMSEWSIVIFSHLPLDYATSKQTVDILKAYLDGTEVNLTKNNIEIKKNYASKNGAVVVANIHGHNHCYNVDYLYQNSDADSKIDVQRICIPNACFERSNERGENGKLDQGDIEYGEVISYEKKANTFEDTSFNVITIDPVARKIYADNYGAGIDRIVRYGLTNQIPISTDTDGNIYNGMGFKENTYLSSGNEGSRNNIDCTGFIPIGCGSSETASNEQVIRLSDVVALADDTTRIAFYKSDKSYINQFNKKQFDSNGYDITIPYETDGSGNIVKIDVTGITARMRDHASAGETAYFRICCSNIDSNSVITVNQEIS